jgi:hypothetical protein
MYTDDDGDKCVIDDDDVWGEAVQQALIDKKRTLTIEVKRFSVNNNVVTSAPTSPAAIQCPPSPITPINSSSSGPTTTSLRTTAAPTTTSPAPEKFHNFIGYRVATDADFASILHDKCIIYAMTELHFSTRPYLDKKCLKDGEPWEDGFSNGLAMSRVFNPIMSWHEGAGHKGSVGGLSDLDPANGKDWADNVLLEYEFALVLQEARGWPKIMPIMLGGPPDDRGFLAFPFGKLGELADVPSAATKEKLKLHCERHGVSLSTEAKTRSIRATVQKLLENQGVQVWTLGTKDVATESTAKKMMAKVHGLLRGQGEGEDTADGE